MAIGKKNITQLANNKLLNIIKQNNKLKNNKMQRALLPVYFLKARFSWPNSHSVGEENRQMTRKTTEP